MKANESLPDDARRREPAAAPVATAAGTVPRQGADEIRSSPRVRQQAVQMATLFGPQAAAPVQRLGAHRFGLRTQADPVCPAALGSDPATVQAKAYTTAANRNGRQLRGSVEVTASAAQVDIAGTLQDAQDKDVEVKGIVYTPEYFVADDRKMAPVPGKSRSGWDNYWNPTNALRVQNVTAEPRGLKLGQLMTYEVAREALRRGKTHVIAMSVSDAREPFYAPLGFVDYDASKPWQDLKRQYDEIENFLRGPESANLPPEAIQLNAQHMADLKEEMSNSSMIISSADLRDNSQAAFGRTWQG